MNWNFFFKEMEKQSGPIGSAIMGAMTIMGMKSGIDEQQKKMKLDPMDINQPPLPSINEMQFEGGKRLPTQSTVLPHSTRYM